MQNELDISNAGVICETSLIVAHGSRIICDPNLSSLNTPISLLVKGDALVGVPYEGPLRGSLMEAL